MAKINQLAQRIEALFLEMRDLSFLAGVKVAYYVAVKQVDENLTVEEFEDRIKFLEHVKANEYEEYKKVYNLVPPQTWKMYELLGQKKLEEQLLLKEKASLLRKVWRKKYDQNNKKSNQDATSEESI